MVERNVLCSLAAYVNVNGEEAVNRRVREETTRLERLVNRGEEEWRTDVLMFRRFRRIPLDHEGARVLTRFFWSVMADEENGFRYRRQKRIM